MKTALVVLTLICALNATELGLVIEDHGFLLNWITIIPTANIALTGGHTASNLLERKFYIFAGYYKALRAGKLTPNVHVAFSHGKTKDQVLQIKEQNDDQIVFVPVDVHTLCAPNNAITYTAISADVVGAELKVNLAVNCKEPTFTEGLQQMAADKVNDVTGMQVGDALTKGLQNEITGKLFNNIV